MRKSVFLVCSILFLLCACSDNDNNTYSEHYAATFIELEPGNNVSEDNLFQDKLFDYVPFNKEEIGMAEPIQKGSNGKRTEITYDLVMQTSDAILSIKRKTEDEKRFVQSKEFKYTYTPGTYMNGLIEVNHNEIIVNGEIYRKLTNFSEIRKESYGEEYIETITETKDYHGVLAIQQLGNIVELKNDDYIYEVEYINSGCNLIEMFPDHKEIGILDRQ
jgi:hypothetical protein|nr:MAG: hypothetical protein [Bacteriophage sp.]